MRTLKLRHWVKSRKPVKRYYMAHIKAGYLPSEMNIVFDTSPTEMVVKGKKGPIVLISYWEISKNDYELFKQNPGLNG